MQEMLKQSAIGEHGVKMRGLSRLSNTTCHAVGSLLPPTLAAALMIFVGTFAKTERT